MKRPDYRKRLLNRISKLKPIEVMGVARIMKVDLYDENKQIKEGYGVLIEFIQAIEALTDSQVKKYLKLLKGV